jgi:cell shape-determining protein MreC
LDDEFGPTYDELHDLLESLYDEFKKLVSKYSTLKKNMHACLLKKKACIMIDDSDKMNKLKSENKSLKEKGRQA